MDRGEKITPKTKEAEIPAASLDVGEIMEDAAFVDFLKRSGDNEREITASTIGERYRQFKKKNYLTEKLSSYYQKEISENLGIDFKAGGHKAIGDYFERLTYERPLMLDMVFMDFQDYEAANKVADENERVIEQLGGMEIKTEALAALNKREDELIGAKKMEWRYTFTGSLFHKAKHLATNPIALTGLFVLSPIGAAVGGAFLGAASFKIIEKTVTKLQESGKFGPKDQAEALERRRIGDRLDFMGEKERATYFERINSELAEVRKKIEFHEKPEVQQEYEKMRKHYNKKFFEAESAFFGDFEVTREVYAAAMAESWKQACSLFEAGVKQEDPVIMEQVSKRIRKFSETAKKFTPEQLKAINMDEIVYEKLRYAAEDLDESIEYTTKGLIARALKGFEPLAGPKTGFRGLDDLMKPFFAKEQIGGKKGEAARQMILDAIREQITSLADENRSSDVKVRDAEKKIAAFHGELLLAVDEKAKAQIKSQIEGLKNEAEQYKKKKDSRIAKIFILNGLLLKHAGS